MKLRQLYYVQYHTNPVTLVLHDRAKIKTVKLYQTWFLVSQNFLLIRNEKAQYVKE